MKKKLKRKANEEEVVPAKRSDLVPVSNKTAQNKMAKKKRKEKGRRGVFYSYVTKIIYHSTIREVN